MRLFVDDIELQKKEYKLQIKTKKNSLLVLPNRTEYCVL